MISKRQLITFFGLAFFVWVGTAAMQIPHTSAKNLKVLPKDISDEMLDSIMHTYNKALNVSCDFCHSEDKTVFNGGLKFELDDNPMKEEARKMMRLNIQINKDYFYFDSTRRPEYLNVVTCITCHRGEPLPIEHK